MNKYCLNQRFLLFLAAIKNTVQSNLFYRNAWKVSYIKDYKSWIELYWILYFKVTGIQCNVENYK